MMLVSLTINDVVGMAGRRRWGYKKPSFTNICGLSIVILLADAVLSATCKTAEDAFAAELIAYWLSFCPFWRPEST